MRLTVRHYSESDAESWDALCMKAEQATLLHTRRFLSYHGNRFIDRSLLIEDEGRLLGLLPAAEHPGRNDHVVSHPGISYGGIIHAGALRGARMLDALQAACRDFQARDYQCLVYKAVPTFYHRYPSQDDVYALFRLGASRTRCDLSSTIDLQCRGAVSERRRRGLKKARKAGVEIVADVAYLPKLWDVLTENLARKHGLIPVHSLADITLLAERFPDSIRCVCGISDQQVVAGVVIFHTATTDHAQYIASNERGYEVSALDAVLGHCIAQAEQAGKRWFDFGVSTEDEGATLNEGLYGFKSEFGAGGCVHEFYQIMLRNF